MKEITLSLVERIFLIGVFNQKEKGHDIETLRAVLDDIKEITISEDERKEANFRNIMAEDGKTVERFEWDKPIDKKIKLSGKTVEYILGYIKEKSDKKELGVADAPLLEIESKLK